MPEDFEVAAPSLPAPPAADPALVPFLEEIETSAAERLLAEVMARHADPVIRSVLRRKLAVTLAASDGGERNQDALELASEVGTRLVGVLRRLKREREHEAISDFRAYVAVTAYNRCHDYLRRLHPARWRLRNKLRYLLTHRPALDLWPSPDRDWLCGLSKWGRPQAPAQSAPEEPRGSIQAFLGDAGTPASAGASSDRQIEGLLRWVGAPIPLDRLVDLAAELWRVEDASPIPVRDVERRPIGVTAMTPEVELSQRSYLERVWNEIGELPSRQRAALLLGLRDASGRGMVGLLPLVGIASVRDIAAALETPAERFAEHWRTLPWDDTRIARHLGVERQQVVNLRKAARARLARRMRGW